jgi:hypothetical protein
MQCNKRIHHNSLKTNIRKTKSKQTQAINITTDKTANRNQPKPTDEDHTIDLLPIITTQEKIGWDQVLKGRCSVEWISTYNCITKTNNGLTWAVKNLKKKWEEIYNIWKQRNNSVHKVTTYIENMKIEALNDKITAVRD